MAICFAAGIPAIARSASDTPPPLPPIPNLSPPASMDAPPPLPTLTSPDNGLPNLPVQTQASIPQIPIVMPEKDGSKADAKSETKAADTKPLATKTDNAPATVSALPDLPPIPATDASKPADIAANDSLALPAGMPALPGLPMPPTIPGASGNAPDTSLPTLALNGDKATAIPEVKVNAEKKEKPKEKTWETKLAPTVVPEKITFNYKRELLPDSIYRTHYEEWNKHLPTRITRQDYQNLLFKTASSNDVDGTRALLNAGADINAKDADGETPLTVAQRSNAPATAALITARGGHS